MASDASLFSLIAYGDTGYGDEILKGAWLTIQISFCSYLLGFGLGLLGAGAKLSGNRWLMRLGDFYTTLIRAMPEVLLLLLLYYVGTSQLKALLMGFGLVDETFDINAFAAAVSALGFIQGAYLTEVIRGAILSVPKGQMEAARAYGMPFHLRFRRILFPQMIRYAIPGLGNIWLNATKDSSLISVTGAALELLKTGSMAASATKAYTFFYSMTAGCFLVISIVSMILFHFAERRANRGMRRA
jgi:His/Glu/Gln/Arg/opine family amino acid ABC transporter permease subunit